MHRNEKLLSLDEFLSIPFPITIKETKGAIWLFVPKLNILVESNSLESAYALLKEQKVTFYQRFESIDGIDCIPRLNDFHRDFLQRIELSKVVVERLVSFVFTLFFWIFLLAIISVQLKKGSVKIRDAFDGTSPEKNEARLMRFKENLKVATPYIKEVQKLLNE
ncbi:MAG: hypothetical protein COW00_10850 [Bdellovibrio sp. CG12_big_fil_rev_8_21_14_0_65_39_13]|nr:MAG: hypothetical protein COW78_03825 [Bdellovibrio sp. CG22_combo_CG10-13_8_21_14_all_39_27]PIQ59377.1 MAG: hypothetical protein COW00_10850 [Bdellovibrio sp. CG12_big_fil_rev_8_21_14_0_65_39_13]PIR35720.1 MAG: hypothetical protein COV37_07105 [Bdellovibrio sp. CG11_big_fil_rev_8_21_14_0_20_39_38]